jgi:hypothetical protein
MFASSHSRVGKQEDIFGRTCREGEVVVGECGVIKVLEIFKEIEPHPQHKQCDDYNEDQRCPFLPNKIFELHVRVIL